MVAKQRLEDEHERDLILAWQVNALARTEKLPDLQTLVRRTRPQRPRTIDDARTQLDMLSAHLHIPLRKRTRSVRG